MTTQARFWVWWRDGWVRVKLNAGQSVVIWHGGPTDEGYSRTVETYSFDGESVLSVVETDGRDCDGRHDSHWQGVCPVSMLSALPAYQGEVPGVPAWFELGKGQRDHFAESAGY